MSFFALEIGSVNLVYGEHDSTHDLPEFWYRLQIYYVNDWGSESMAEFLHGARRGNIVSTKISRPQDFLHTKRAESDIR